MKITLSVIKTDIGSIGGHIAPSRRLLETVKAQIAERGRELIIDHCVSHAGTSYFGGLPLVGCAAFAMHQGKLTEPLDCFAHPFWDEVRSRVAGKSMEMRRQGFFGAAMLPMSELEYTGIIETLAALDSRFRVRAEASGRVAA